MLSTKIQTLYLILTLTNFILGVTPFEWNDQISKEYLKSAFAPISKALQNLTNSFVVSYHSFPKNLQPILETGYLLQYTFQPEYSRRIDPTRISNRFNQPFQIVLGYLKSEYAAGNIIKTFFLFSLNPTTIVILFHPSQFSHEPSEYYLHSLVITLPALKFVLTNNFELALICAGFCTNKTVRTVDVPKYLLNSPLSFHRHIFYQSSRKLILSAFISFQEEPRVSQRWCDRIQFGCLDKASKSNIIFRDSEITTAILLSHVHNISFKLWNKTNELEYRKWVNTEPYLNSKRTYLEYATLANHRKTGLYFSETSSSIAIYCLRSENDETDQHVGLSSTWISPFSKDLWILIIFVLLCPSLIASQISNGLFLHFSVFFNTLIHSVGIFVGESIPAFRTHFLRHVCWIVAIVGGILGNLWSNELLSLIVVDSPPFQFSSLVEILDAGYKFIWNNDTTTVSAYKQYELDFKMFGALDKLNTSFHEIQRNNYWDLKEVEKRLVDKYMRFFLQERADFSTRLFESHIKKMPGHQDTRCRYLSQKFYPTMVFWEVFVINREWMKITLMGIRENGLQEKWDDWYFWALKQDYKLQGGGDENGRLMTGKDAIVLEVFATIQFLWAMIMSLGLLLFVIEYLSHHGFWPIKTLLKKWLNLVKLRFNVFSVCKKLLM